MENLKIELTNEECVLLRSLLAFMTDNYDWELNEGTNLMKAEVLMRHDENVNLSSEVTKIYDKLFSV